MFKIIVNRKIVSILFVLALLAGLIFLYFVQKPEEVTLNGRINVVTSFYPLSYLAQVVGGDFVSVHNLVPAGVEPHDFEPSTRDLIEIGKADILIYNGAALEPWVKKWNEGIAEKPKRVINMAEMLRGAEVRLIGGDGVMDPHFWLDPTIMKNEGAVVLEALSLADPMHKDVFSKNLERLLSSLDALNQRFVDGLAVCSLNDVVVLHEAFNYLGRQYNFRVTSIEGISPDEEPSPKELVRIIEMVREKGVKHIFFETVASPKFSELIAREIEGETLVLNPIESLTPNEVQSGEDYISLMEMNLNNLRKAMSCK